LLFLPPYSPDLNPIEESFNVSMYLGTFISSETVLIIVKAWLCRAWRRFYESEAPLADLYETCMNAVTPEKAKAWFIHCGYQV
ncbi:hypothetical protein BV22DRAFT_1012509, partial [Leucogyrophana mollusca]